MSSDQLTASPDLLLDNRFAEVCAREALPLSEAIFHFQIGLPGQPRVRGAKRDCISYVIHSADGENWSFARPAFLRYCRFTREGERLSSYLDDVLVHDNGTFLLNVRIATDEAVRTLMLKYTRHGNAPSCPGRTGESDYTAEPTGSSCDVDERQDVAAAAEVCIANPKPAIAVPPGACGTDHNSDITAVDSAACDLPVLTIEQLIRQPGKDVLDLAREVFDRLARDGRLKVGAKSKINQRGTARLIFELFWEHYFVPGLGMKTDDPRYPEWRLRWIDKIRNSVVVPGLAEQAGSGESSTQRAYPAVQHELTR